MKSRYRVEIRQEIITPIIVEANTKQEAIDSALQQQGEAGDCYYSDEIKIASVTKTEGVAV